MEYLKTEKFLREYQFILVEQNMLVNLKITNQTDMEPLFGQMVINTMENGKMVKAMVTEPKYGKMEENIWENLKMTNCMEKEHYFTPTAKNMKGIL